MVLGETDPSKRREPESFWGNTKRDELNPELILAQILAQRGLVTISEDATDMNGNALPTQVRISAGDTGRELLDRVGWRREFWVIRGAYRGRYDLGFGFEGDLREFQWDEEFKDRLRALYYSRHAAREKDSVKANSHEERTANPADIRTLLEEIISLVSTEPLMS